MNRFIILALILNHTIDLIFYSISVFNLQFDTNGQINITIVAFNLIANLELAYQLSKFGIKKIVNIKKDIFLETTAYLPGMPPDTELYDPLNDP